MVKPSFLNEVAGRIAGCAMKVAFDVIFMSSITSPFCVANAMKPLLFAL